jgi:hypothetical protein
MGYGFRFNARLQVKCGVSVRDIESLLFTSSNECSLKRMQTGIIR